MAPGDVQRVIPPIPDIDRNHLIRPAARVNLAMALQ